MAVFSRVALCVLGLTLLSACVSVNRAKEVESLSHFRVYVNDYDSNSYVAPEKEAPKGVEVTIGGLIGLVLNPASQSEKDELELAEFQDKLASVFTDFPSDFFQRRLKRKLHSDLLLESKPLFFASDDLKRFELEVSKVGLFQSAEEMSTGLYQLSVEAKLTPIFSLGKQGWTVQAKLTSRSDIRSGLEEYATDSKLRERALKECAEGMADSVKAYLKLRSKLRSFSPEEVSTSGSIEQ